MPSSLLVNFLTGYLTTFLKALCVLKGGGDRKPETQILKVEEV